MRDPFTPPRIEVARGRLELPSQGCRAGPVDHGISVVLQVGARASASLTRRCLYHLGYRGMKAPGRLRTCTVTASLESRLALQLFRQDACALCCTPIPATRSLKPGVEPTGFEPVTRATSERVDGHCCAIVATPSACSRYWRPLGAGFFTDFNGQGPA